MKYYMRSKFFKLKEDFWIRDQHKEDAFLVNTKFLSIGLQFNLINSGRILYTIREKIIALLPSYEIVENGVMVAKVNRKISFIKDKIKVDSKYGAMEIVGDIFDYNYKIYKDNKIIGSVSKEFFAFTDNYEVDVDFEDDAFILSLVVIIDNIIDKQKR